MHHVLTWAIQRVPDCDMVLVHDDDLARISEICNCNVSRHFLSAVFFLAHPRSQDTLRSDTLIQLLQKYQPNIEQVLCGTCLQALRLL